jgi:transcriptional regulator with XRE-family HTH domain
MKLAKALSLRLKHLREASGLSQQEVAVKADLSLSLVAKLEQGKKADPRASTLLALAEALGVRPGRLLEDLFPPAAINGVAEVPPPGEVKKKKKAVKAKVGPKAKKKKPAVKKEK